LGAVLLGNKTERTGIRDRPVTGEIFGTPIDRTWPAFDGEAISAASVQRKIKPSI